MSAERQECDGSGYIRTAPPWGNAISCPGCRNCRPCETCDGSGTVREQIESGPPEGAEFTCHACFGTGVQPASPTGEPCANNKFGEPCGFCHPCRAASPTPVEQPGTEEGKGASASASALDNALHEAVRKVLAAAPKWSLSEGHQLWRERLLEELRLALRAVEGRGAENVSPNPRDTLTDTELAEHQAGLDDIAHARSVGFNKAEAEGERPDPGVPVTAPGREERK